MEGDGYQEIGYLWGLPSRRREAGLSQAEVALVSGISQKQISRYERHKVKPHPSTLQKLAVALKCKIKDLFVNKIEE